MLAVECQDGLGSYFDGESAEEEIHLAIGNGKAVFDPEFVCSANSILALYFGMRRFSSAYKLTALWETRSSCGRACNVRTRRRSSGLSPALRKSVTHFGHTLAARSGIGNGPYIINYKCDFLKQPPAFCSWQIFLLCLLAVPRLIYPMRVGESVSARPHLAPRRMSPISRFLFGCSGPQTGAASALRR